MDNEVALTHEQFAHAAFAALAIIDMLESTSPETSEEINKLLDRAPGDTIVKGAISALSAISKAGG